MKSTNTFAAFHFASYLDVSLAWDCWRVNKSRKANRQTKRLTVFDIFAREKETHVGNFLRNLGRCNLTYVGVELELRGGNTLRLADRGDGWWWWTLSCRIWWVFRFHFISFERSDYYMSIFLSEDIFALFFINTREVYYEH